MEKNFFCAAPRSIFAGRSHRTTASFRFFSFPSSSSSSSSKKKRKFLFYLCKGSLQRIFATPPFRPGGGVTEMMFLHTTCARIAPALFRSFTWCLCGLSCAHKGDIYAGTGFDSLSFASKKATIYDREIYGIFDCLKIFRLFAANVATESDAAGPNRIPWWQTSQHINHFGYFFARRVQGNREMKSN